MSISATHRAEYSSIIPFHIHETSSSNQLQGMCRSTEGLLTESLPEYYLSVCHDFFPKFVARDYFTLLNVSVCIVLKLNFAALNLF
jgi:hypothetical protein